MTNLITKKFRIHIAEQVKESLEENDPSQYYVFISRVQPWPSESSPPTPVDTVQYTDYDIWRGMVGLKKVSNNAVTFSIPKYDWTANTIYTEYSNTNENLFDSQFYVYTPSQRNVYKCMFNNRGAQSTVQPTGTSTSTITTSDGYKWKFMYKISDADLDRFLTNDFIPVKTLTADDSSAQFDVQQAASNGSIIIYDVTANGTGYLENKGTVVSIPTSSTLVVNSSASGTDKVYNGSTVFISSGLGAGQLREIINYAATTKTLTLNTAFSVVPNTESTYHIGPNVTVIGDGRNASAYANVSGGQIQRITSINNGQNYSKAQVTISANTTYGSGATAVAYLSPPGGHGSDPVQELGGSNVSFNVKLVGEESGFISANNQFRVFGLIKDVQLQSNGAVATGPRYDQTTKLTLTSVSGEFTQDEFVSGGTSAAVGRVVEFANTNASGTTGILKLVDIDGSFANTETVTGNNSSITGVINGIAGPTIRPFTGKLLYTTNRTAIPRDLEQTENITFTLRF